MQTLREIKSELIRLKWHVAAARFSLSLRRHALAIKGTFDPAQPRVPAGHSNGGQWTSGGGGTVSVRFPRATGDDGGFGASDEGGGLFDDFEDFYGYDGAISLDWSGAFDDFDFTDYSDARRRPGIGHNQGPPLKDPSDIPPKRPETARERNRIAQAISQNAALSAYIITLYTTGMHHWINEKYSEIKADQDPPKDLAELQDGVLQPDKKGYDVHHIVERSPAESSGFPKSLINGPDNLILIPRYKHWKLNSWYETPNHDYNGSTPRQYLQDKDWSERRRVGLDGLRAVGVLKP